jgi:hypothetical protein
MIKRYFDFELEISIKGERIEIDIDGRPTGFNLPEPIQVPLKEELVDWKKINSCNAHEIAPLGHSLFSSIFIPAISSMFGAYLGRRKEDEGVRLCIKAQSNDLAKAAWEILCSRLTPIASFLALNPRTPIIRCVRISSEVYLRDIGIPLRLLVVLASPRFIEKIDPKEIKDALENALKDLTIQGQIDITYLGFDDRTEANFDKLQEHLSDKEPYDIVHIIAHGLLEKGFEGITALVESEDGKQQDVFASNLANLFLSSRAMLVILQSCQSGAVDPSALVFSGTAQQLVASGIPAVLAMQETIDQDVASYFINRLYSQWLDAECSFEEALTQARQSVKHKYSERIASWAIPVLYVCPGVQLSIKKLIAAAETNDQQVVKRRVEAALPQLCRVDKETELLVLIRAFDKRGLQDILSQQPQDYDARPEDIRKSNEFQVSLPIDEEARRILPANIRIVVETSDFESKLLDKMVKIYPQGDSVLCIFLITPKEKGLARANVRVLDNNEAILAELLLKTRVCDGESFEAEYGVTGAELSKEQAAKEIMDYHLEEYQLSQKDTDYSLRELIHIILPSEREQITYAKQFIQALTSSLTESEVETSFVEQIKDLNNRLAIIEAEFLESEYLRETYQIELSQWSHHFYYFLHRVYSTIGEERYKRLIRSAHFESELKSKYPPTGPLPMLLYYYDPIVFNFYCHNFCDLCMEWCGCNLLDRFELLRYILNKVESLLSIDPSYQDAHMEIKDLNLRCNHIYIELKDYGNIPTKYFLHEYLYVLKKFYRIIRRYQLEGYIY